jgi:hypothetical protein
LTQPETPLAGLGPAIHAFPAVDQATSEDVGSRNKMVWAGGEEMAPSPLKHAMEHANAAAQ